MMVIAMRSSTTARVSRNDRSADGRCVRDDREHGEGEGDVGRRRDGPAPEHVTLAAGQQRRDRTKSSGGHRDTADRGRDRQRRLAAVGQVAGDELALELDPRDEEEERQQAVGGPRPEAEVEVQRVRADDEVAQGDVGVRHGVFAQTRATTAAPRSSAPPTVSVRSADAT